MGVSPASKEETEIHDGGIRPGRTGLDTPASKLHMRYWTLQKRTR